MKLDSKIGKVAKEDKKIYEFLTDFNNFKSLIPPEKVQNWQADKDSCRFTVAPIGDVGFKILEKQPYSLIKLTNLEEVKHDFNFWVQLKQLTPTETVIKLTMDVKLNPMLQMMAKGPIQQFLDTLIDQLKKIDFDKIVLPNEDK